MKKILFISLMACFSIQAKENPLVIFHLDINKTIVAQDLAGGKSTDYVLISSLAEVIYDYWDSTLKKKISYASYVKEYLLPGPKSNQKLKKKRIEKIGQFLEHLREINHPDFQKIYNRYKKLKAILDHNPSFILPSCFALLDYLQKQHIPHIIILRTFGTDLEKVIQELEYRYGKDFFTARGAFSKNKLTIFNHQTHEQKILPSIDEIYTFIRNSKGHIAIQDDWAYWNSHGEIKEYGKLFPIDPDDSTVIHCFADDNVFEKGGILNPRHAKTNRALNTDECIKKGTILPVDILAAIEDDQYFITHLKNLL